jgi:hypothetical protein
MGSSPGDSFFIEMHRKVAYIKFKVLEPTLRKRELYATNCTLGMVCLDHVGVHNSFCIVEKHISYTPFMSFKIFLNR